MEFISVRDLRSKPASIRKRLPLEKEMVLTANGKPIAILSSVTGKTLEKRLTELRRSRAMSAVEAMQMRSVEKGTDRLSLKEIDKEIEAERKSRRAK